MDTNTVAVDTRISKSINLNMLQLIHVGRVTAAALARVNSNSHEQSYIVVLAEKLHSQGSELLSY